MQTPKKFAHTFSTDFSYKKSDLILTGHSNFKAYTNIGNFTPGLNFYSNQQGSPLLARGKYSQKYQKREYQLDNSQVKANFLNNMQKLNNTTQFDTSQIFKIKNYSSNIASRVSNSQRKISIVATPTTQQSHAARGVFTSVDAKTNKQIYSPMKNQTFNSVLDDSRNRRSNSANKKGKYITVISRMPINKKKAIHNV